MSDTVIGSIPGERKTRPEEIVVRLDVSYEDGRGSIVPLLGLAAV